MLDFIKQQKQPNNSRVTNRNLQPIGIDIRQIQWITTLCRRFIRVQWIMDGECGDNI